MQKLLIKVMPSITLSKTVVDPCLVRAVFTLFVWYLSMCCQKIYSRAAVVLVVWMIVVMFLSVYRTAPATPGLLNKPSDRDRGGSRHKPLSNVQALSCHGHLGQPCPGSVGLFAWWLSRISYRDQPRVAGTTWPGQGYQSIHFPHSHNNNQNTAVPARQAWLPCL